VPCDLARSVACRRSCERAIAWKVPAVILPSTPRRPMRETSSPAALRVKVTASTWRASRRPSRAPYAMRRVSTLVLPEPAGAMIARGAASDVTASCWSGSRSWSSASRTLGPYTAGVTVACVSTRRNAASTRGVTGRDAAKPRVVFAALAAPISSGPYLRCPADRHALAGARQPVCRPVRLPEGWRTSRPARTSVPLP
jgi:hypothetical protein